MRALEQQDKGMIFELSDISLIKNHVDDIRALDGNNKILIEAMQTSEKGVFIAENFWSRDALFSPTRHLIDY